MLLFIYSYKFIKYIFIFSIKWGFEKHIFNLYVFSANVLPWKSRSIFYINVLPAKNCEVMIWKFMNFCKEKLFNMGCISNIFWNSNHKKNIYKPRISPKRTSKQYSDSFKAYHLDIFGFRIQESIVTPSTVK